MVGLCLTKPKCLQEEPQPPNPKKRINTISEDVRFELVAKASLLPADAQKDGYDGSSQSYTLHGPDGSDCKISVLVAKSAFYVFPVQVLPKFIIDKGGFKINCQVLLFTRTYTFAWWSGSA